MIHSSEIELTDMFCGCGGSSEGARNVAGVRVRYALNHWDLAIQTHNTNHPDTHHDCADISETHPARYAPTTGLIASPECTNHSLAKGQRRKNLHQQEIFQNKAFDASAVRSRATMWDVPRFAEVHRYQFVIVENVVDVRMWVMFEPWLSAMHALGYLHECVYLNAQHAHGDGISGFAPQSRDRIYIVFWKKGNRKPDLNIRPKAPCSRCGTVEAFQSWKNGRKSGKYKTQYIYRCSVCMEVVVPYYYAALNAIDWSFPMVRIGDREANGMQPLKPNTIARIEYGLKKHGLKPTILNQAQGTGSYGGRVKSAMDEPLQTQSTRKSSYLFSPFLFNMAFTHAKGDRSYGVDQVFPTQTTQESLGLVTPFVMANRANANPLGMEDRLPTVTGRNNDLMLIDPEGVFMPILRNNSQVNKATEPLPTQSTKITNGIVIPPSAILTMRGDRNFSTMTDSIGTQVAAAIQNYIVSASPLLTPYHGTHQASSITEPSPTIPTRDNVAFVETMAQPKVEECYFRMLQPSETARAQGFPEGYVILGSKDKQQKQIGNANPPPTMELLVARCVASLE
jgi:DNA (cytosine-5)-methyltransferase 1